MKTRIKRLLLLMVIIYSGRSFSQVLSNGTVTPNITAENPFLDASTNFDLSVDPSSVGKGLVFPRTDLTQFTFNTAAMDGAIFPTAFDGMLVYNIGIGTTVLGQGIQTTVVPGYYYFVNPGASTDISNGQWLPLSGNTNSVLGTISTLDCNGASVFHTGNFYQGLLGNGTTEISYTGGDAGVYATQLISSTGVTGLNALLIGSNFNLGTGTLEFIISGTPTSSGTANFNINVGGVSCSFSRTVLSPQISIGCNIAQTESSYGTVTGIPGAPSLIWINRNLGASTQASTVSDASDASAGCYFQFNESQPFGNDLTDGATTVSPNWVINGISDSKQWLLSNDPCRIQLGNLWRVPTASEWASVDGSGAWGNSSQAFSSNLKLHQAGYLSYTLGTLFGRGNNGGYWSSTPYDHSYGKILFINNGNSEIFFYNKAFGFNIRCVK